MRHMFQNAGVRASVICLLALGLAASPVFAQQKPKPAQPPASVAKAQPAPASAAEKAMMDAMMKAATPGENHKLLASIDGNWTFVNKYWMDPKAPPAESTGTATRTPIMGGRYIQGVYKGVMGGMPFEGMGIDAYDNVTQQFVSSWIDNMGTGLTVLSGKYNAATKTVTYKGDTGDMMNPGKTYKVRQVIRLETADRFVMEWYETHGGKEAKTMEIVYTRKK